MNKISAVIRRDVLLALRSGGAWLHSLLFFVVFISVSAIAFGGDDKILQPLAPSLIWLAIIMSLLLSFESMFSADYEDGNLEQMKLSGTSLVNFVAGKSIAHWLLIALPLLLALPVVALMLNLSIQLCLGLFFSVLIASPALIAYGAFSGACLVGYKGSGMLIILLTIPVIIPIIIFGISAVNGYTQAGLSAFEFKALAGLSLIACGIAIPAGAAALNALME